MDTKHNPAWKKIRQFSDEVCKEMGLSVIAYGEISKGVSHYEWTKQQQGLSWKAKFRYELDCIIQRSDTFEDFLEKCRLNGIEAVYKPENAVSLKFRIQGQQRFARAKTLGYYYLPENIQRRIRQFSSHRKMILDRSKFDNRGLQYWADIQNMKNVAQMINLLESYNVHSTAELKPTTMTVMARRGMITQSIENLDKKINTLSEQIELVRQFQRSKPYHDKYKSLSAWKQKEYAKKNAPVLEKYKSVGSQLKLLYPDGRFPSEWCLIVKGRCCMRNGKNFMKNTATSKKSMLIWTRQVRRLTIILKVCVMSLNVKGKRESWSKWIDHSNWKSTFLTYPSGIYSR